MTLEPSERSMSLPTLSKALQLEHEFRIFTSKTAQLILSERKTIAQHKEMPLSEQQLPKVVAIQIKFHERVAESKPVLK